MNTCLARPRLDINSNTACVLVAKSARLQVPMLTPSAYIMDFLAPPRLGFFNRTVCCPYIAFWHFPDSADNVADKAYFWQDAAPVPRFFENFIRSR